MEKRHAADQALQKDVPPGSIGDPSSLRCARVREGCFLSTCSGPAYWKVRQVYPQEAGWIVALPMTSGSVELDKSKSPRLYPVAMFLRCVMRALVRT